MKMYRVSPYVIVFLSVLLSLSCIQNNPIEESWEIVYRHNAEGEVFAQITPIFGQKPSLDSDTFQIALNHQNHWTMIIGTNGERSTISRKLDMENQPESKQSNRGATWFVKVPAKGLKKGARPLWD